ncbi:DUF397 domain-containing protein [Streptomyces sp. NPDC059568]|uniref:DUF397 domain-containing protein n=1 Tax=unclassified Streptomyces TaxID=2593676 RepID=UPI00364E9CFC
MQRNLTQLTQPTWYKSSYSGDQGNCLEVASTPGSGLAVRDSKAPTSPALRFPTGSWSSFLTAVKDETLTA